MAVVADDRNQYQLGVTRREGRREALVRLRIGDATDVASGFTGVVLGPYATGRGTTCEADAVVERFVYESGDS